MTPPTSDNKTLQSNKELTYDEALNHIDDLKPFVVLANDLKSMADDGRINDMRRALVVFNVAHTQQRILAVLDEVESELPDTTFHGSSIRVKENIRDGGFHDGVAQARRALATIKAKYGGKG